VAIREESYADFTTRVHSDAASRRVPVKLDYDVTYRCNLNCRHCCVSLAANDRDAIRRELSVSEAERILAELRDLGALWILLTGGEPLLRPDFRDIYLATLKLGLIPVVFTNGTLVDEDWAEFFSRYRPHRLEITLYGSCAEVYERVTRTPGSFERCMRGIKLLRERGLPLNLKTMVLQSNLADVHLVKRFAASLGVPFRMDPQVQPRYRDLPRMGADDPKTERVPLDEVLRLDQEDLDRHKAWLGDCDRLIRFASTAGPGQHTCGAGRTVLSLTAFGTARPCALMRDIGWDFLGTSVERVWRECMDGWECLTPTLPEQCHTCRLRALCSMCPAWLALGDSQEDTVSYLCPVAHGREKLFSTKGEAHDPHEEEVPASHRDKSEAQAY